MSYPAASLVAMVDIGLLRLAAQRIATPGLDTPAAAVRWMTAMQAQDHGGALTSVALRTAGCTREAVEAAFNAGEIVKSWPMRGTLHLTAAEDLPWLLELTAPRVLAGSAGRRAELGLDLSTLELAGQVAVDALTGGQRLSRAELLDVWDKAGAATTGQRGYHMILFLAQTGLICFGPIVDGEPHLVLVEEWIRRPRILGRDEALGELALRYFASHGPATVKDLTRWANLTAADARTGLALALPRLEGIEVDGVRYFMDPQTPDLLDACLRRARGVFLLPGFDEYLLGYGDRTAVLPAEFANLIVPGGNGMFKPTVVSAGQVIGTWKHTGRGAKRTIEATPFTSFTAAVDKAITQAYARLP
jgi:Winged helix DNA-binding domain